MSRAMVGLVVVGAAVLAFMWYFNYPHVTQHPLKYLLVNSVRIHTQAGDQHRVFNKEHSPSLFAEISMADDHHVSLRGTPDGYVAFELPEDTITDNQRRFDYVSSTGEVGYGTDWYVLPLSVRSALISKP